jgi:hypothetical protein
MSSRAYGPDVVPGVAELRKLGFEPVEEHTGMLLVAEMWPDEHRRFVPETRELWLEEEPQLGGRLWLLRSPWKGWTLSETFTAMFRWLERPDVEGDPDYLLAGVADFLRWDEGEARKWRPGSDALEK